MEWWNQELEEIAEIIPLLQSEKVSEIINKSSTNKSQIDSNKFTRKFKNKFWK